MILRFKTRQSTHLKIILLRNWGPDNRTWVFYTVIELSHEEPVPSVHGFADSAIKMQLVPVRLYFFYVELEHRMRPISDAHISVNSTSAGLN